MKLEHSDTIANVRVITGWVEFNIVDGIHMPRLRMTFEWDGCKVAGLNAWPHAKPSDA